MFLDRHSVTNCITATRNGHEILLCKKAKMTRRFSRDNEFDRNSCAVQFSLVRQKMEKRWKSSLSQILSSLRNNPTWISVIKTARRKMGPTDKTREPRVLVASLSQSCENALFDRPKKKKASLSSSPTKSRRVDLSRRKTLPLSHSSARALLLLLIWINTEKRARRVGIKVKKKVKEFNCTR